jgi:hypothetical protein
MGLWGMHLNVVHEQWTDSSSHHSHAVNKAGSWWGQCGGPGCCRCGAGGSLCLVVVLLLLVLWQLLWRRHLVPPKLLLWRRHLVLHVVVNVHVVHSL